MSQIDQMTEMNEGNIRHIYDINATLPRDYPLPKGYLFTYISDENAIYVESQYTDILYDRVIPPIGTRIYTNYDEHGTVLSHYFIITEDNVNTFNYRLYEDDTRRLRHHFRIPRNEIRYIVRSIIRRALSLN